MQRGDSFCITHAKSCAVVTRRRRRKRGLRKGGGVFRAVSGSLVGVSFKPLLPSIAIGMFYFDVTFLLGKVF